MRGPVVTLALGAALAASSCALVDALLGPRLSTPEELCDEVDRIWDKCQMDRDACVQHIECLLEQRVGCDEVYADWVRCLQDSEPSCPSDGSGEAMPCHDKYGLFLECIGDNQRSGQQKIGDCLSGQASCGNGVCEPHLGESPRACHQDCTKPCSTEAGGFCTPFRGVQCSECLCDVDGVCDPLRENRTTCPEDCACDNDGHCDAGESTEDCPSDCPCDFDTTCDDGDNETWLSCPDCGACDGPSCGNAEGQTCIPGIGCRVPLVCEETGLACRLLCLADDVCPLGFHCDAGGMCLPN